MTVVYETSLEDPKCKRFYYILLKSFAGYILARYVIHDAAPKGPDYKDGPVHKHPERKGSEQMEPEHKGSEHKGAEREELEQKKPEYECAENECPEHECSQDECSPNECSEYESSGYESFECKSSEYESSVYKGPEPLVHERKEETLAEVWQYAACPCRRSLAGFIREFPPGTDSSKGVKRIPLWEYAYNPREPAFVRYRLKEELHPIMWHYRCYPSFVGHTVVRRLHNHPLHGKIMEDPIQVPKWDYTCFPDGKRASLVPSIPVPDGVVGSIVPYTQQSCPDKVLGQDEAATLQKFPARRIVSIELQEMPPQKMSTLETPPKRMPALKMPPITVERNSVGKPRLFVPILWRNAGFRFFILDPQRMPKQPKHQGRFANEFFRKPVLCVPEIWSYTKYKFRLIELGEKPDDPDYTYVVYEPPTPYPYPRLSKQSHLLAMISKEICHKSACHNAQRSSRSNLKKTNSDADDTNSDHLNVQNNSTMEQSAVLIVSLVEARKIAHKYAGRFFAARECELFPYKKDD